ncbi:hypothetical protein [Clostridium sp. BL-8]|nr:hypothetical protein [Clostridium sp. BL-8]OOM78290.1 hypothetical protein CLOBL_24370 [Clostridium sp. BL-8]
MNTNGMDSIFLARTLPFTFIICVIVIVIGIIISIKIAKYLFVFQPYKLS